MDLDEELMRNMGDIDNSYKQIFSHPEMVRDLLQGFVREEWVAQLDFSTLEKVSGSYVTDDLRAREDDIIWRVRWGSGWLFIYILLEFQSTVDHFMAVRIGGYVHLLYQDLIKGGTVKKGEKLPPVLPVVLYNGKPRWTAAEEITDLMAPTPSGLERFQPRMRYLLIDEIRYEDAELASQRNLAAALFRLEKSREPEEIRRILAELIEWLKASEQTGLRRSLTVWLRRVLLPGRIENTQLPEMADLHEVETMLAETVQEWTKEWEKKGLEKGRQEGRQEGIASLFLLQAEEKYGQISDTDRKKVLSADQATLEKWSLRLLKFDTLDDVFGVQEL